MSIPMVHIQGQTINFVNASLEKVLHISWRNVTTVTFEVHPLGISAPTQCPVHPLEQFGKSFTGMAISTVVIPKI